MLPSSVGITLREHDTNAAPSANVDARHVIDSEVSEYPRHSLLITAHFSPVYIPRYERGIMSRPTNGHTYLSLKIGHIFLSDRGRRHWNYEIAKRAGGSPRATIEILKSFQYKGWISGYQERENPSGRSPRVLYILTEAGARAFRETLGELQLIST